MIDEAVEIAGETALGMEAEKKAKTRLIPKVIILGLIILIVQWQWNSLVGDEIAGFEISRWYSLILIALIAIALYFVDISVSKKEDKDGKDRGEEDGEEKEEELSRADKIESSINSFNKFFIYGAIVIIFLLGALQAEYGYESTLVEDSVEALTLAFTTVFESLLGIGADLGLKTVMILIFVYTLAYVFMPGGAWLWRKLRGPTDEDDGLQEDEESTAETQHKEDAQKNQPNDPHI